MKVHSGSPSLLRNIAGHSRMLLCIVVGVAVYFTAHAWSLPAPALCGWNAGVVLYLAFAAALMARATEHSIRYRAGLVDESRFIILTVSMAAIFASFAGIVVEMQKVATLDGAIKIVHLALSGLTIVTSWVLIHTIFAQHYAHEYFIVRNSEADLAKEDQAGLRFPGGRTPDYSDFLYFSFVIGVASQTADVAITSRAMRRLNLVHCVLAFFFNTTLLALTINLAASLISGR